MRLPGRKDYLLFMFIDYTMHLQRNPISADKFICARIRNFVFQNAAAFLNCANGGGIGGVTGEQDRVDAALSATVNGQAEHLCGIAFAAFSGSNGIADMTAIIAHEVGI